MGFKLIKRVCCLILLILIAEHSTSAQFFNLEFDAFSTDNGLSQNHVMSITQDKLGFMWFGTENGLNRFDGNEFKLFRNSDTDLHTIPDNNVHTLLVDHDGVLWIGTNNGVCKYYPETESIERLPMDFTNPSKLSGSQVSHIKKDINNNIWITYIGDGVNVITPGKSEIMHYTVNRNDKYKIKSDLVSAIQFMPDGDVLLGTLGGIEVIDKTGYVLTESASATKYPWIKTIDNSVRCLMLSEHDRKLWIGTELNGLYSIDLKTNTVSNYNKVNSRLDFNHILSIYEDSNGNIWVGSEAFYLFDKQRKTLVPYNEYGIQGNLVIKNPVYSIYEDKDQNIWLGTFRLGVLKFNPGNTKILHYHSNQGEGSIKSNEILCFAEDNNNQLWVGTGGAGLFKLRKDLKGFDQAPLNARFSSPTIKCIYKDKRNNFWLGTWDGGMMKYNPSLNKLELFNPSRKNFESRHVWAIKSDSLENLWIGTLRDGLCYFSTSTYQYKYYKYISGDSTSLVTNDVLCLHVDSRKRVWVGTGNGLSILLPGKEKFINFQRKESTVSLSNNIVFCFFEDDQGRMWIGTNGGGITIINPDLSIGKILTTRDGLPNNSITAIQCDDHKNIWVSTYNGLAKISGNDFLILEVPQITGLQGKEFIPGSYLKSSDGRFLFGGVNGFNLFHPDSLSFNPLHENVAFTSLKILNDEILPLSLYDGRKIMDRSITMTDELRLSYKDYSFTIGFAPLTYNGQRGLHYAYFLENFDEEWQYTTADKRFVHYTNLHPGKYSLRVKASFDGKSWPKTAKQLNISIAPPWWATWWFRFGSSALLIGLLYSLYRVRVNFLKKQKEKLEGLVTLRTSELQLSNHELEVKSAELQKIQNQLREINTNLEMLVSERTQKLNTTLDELETFLYRASHDLRGPLSSMVGLMHLARLENYQFSNPWFNDSMEKVITRLERILQKLLDKYTIQRWRVINESITKPQLVNLLSSIEKDIPYFRVNDFKMDIEEDFRFQSDKMMLRILLANLLENAFFFSERAIDNKVLLHAYNEHDTAVITVTDHGPGIKKEIREKIYTMFFRGSEYTLGNGLGLYLVKCVLEKVKGKISLESEEGSFSKFTVSL